MSVQVRETAGQEEIGQTAAWYKALTLLERLETRPSPGRAVDSELAGRRLHHWRNQKPFSDQARFAGWLAKQTLTLEDLVALLGESLEDLRLRTDKAPEWLERLAEARAARDETPLDHPGQPPVNTSANVINALGPVVRSGLARLQRGLAQLAREYETLPFNPAVVTPLLLANLAGQLLPPLSRTLALELNVARLQGRLHGETPEDRFGDFFRQLERGAIWTLLEEYPVLARQVVVQTEHWARFSLEVLDRLCRDWPAIRAAFSPDRGPGQLVEISAGAGDTHRQGRSVLKLGFSGGLQLIYKPRSLALDVHFNELLTWLNERGDHPPFRITRVLDRADYGWVEFVLAEGCETGDEIERFYQRQGGYLALLYALDATDFHHENLIAAGEHPVLIDLEALFHSPLSTASPAHSDDPALDTLARSVLLTGLLPQRLFGDVNHVGIDLSGLNGRAGQLTPLPALRWQGVGTDEMRAVRERLELPGQHNRPRLKGQEVSLLDYAGKLREGFADMYRLLWRERAALMAGPLARFACDEIRLLVRPTHAYARLLQESHHPDLLRDAMDRERFFAVLWAEQSRLSLLIPSELADLWDGDIPMFTARPGSRDAFGSRGERMPALLAEAGLDRVRTRLDKLDQGDLERQLWIIQAALASIPMGDGRKYWRSSRTTPGDHLASGDQLLQAARTVGDRLCEQAVHGPDSANWLTLVMANERDWQLTTTGMDLYDGLSGIILTLAYLGKVTGEVRYTALARAGLRTLRRKADTFQGHLKSVGAFGGWGSLVYLYSHLFALWGDERVLPDASVAVDELRAVAREDEAFDIIGGSAGALLALLSLYRVTHSQPVLELAEECGQHLIGKALPTAGGLGWKNGHAAHAPLAGFSHGAAGIAYSLLALAGATGEEMYREAAQAGIAYERSLFSVDHQNWPILQDSPDGEFDRYRATWCHGAAGIGLARLAGLEYWQDATVSDEIQVALRTTLDRGFGLNHSLCHGDFGNLELLLGLSRLMPDASHHDQLNHQAATALDSIERHGYVPGTPLGVETPGLMTGLAGIGFQLLRLARPDDVPAVLLLAPPN
jgi:type 2 lantibiotic biosynthesis protein LanM